MRKIVAVSSLPFQGRDSLPRTYTEALRRAGAEPFLVGAGCDVPSVLAHADALLLPGGGDIDFGDGKGTDVDRDRDALELELLRAFEASGRHVLGICRGMQVIAWSRGVRSFILPPGAHRHPDGDAFHPIRLFPPLSALLSCSGVNSAHRQAVEAVPPGFAAGAEYDGVLEAIASPRVIGVQWHPERLGDDALFRWLLF
ncbi:MAG: gamma-glutamyl-gamma-aminobutyrate hydrolase family protein [Eubacteriales bacterium]|nr:gamma-glutamyl-gamma-aminobutyrate hydrolase family protein [Eubacteriales bacterium]